MSLSDRQYVYLGGYRAMMSLDGFNVVFDTRDPGMLNSLLTGRYEPVVFNALLQELHPEDCYIDVGANVGMHALRLRRRLNPQGLMYCFEPNPGIFDILRNNILLNGGMRNVHLKQAAVYDNPGKVTFSHIQNQHRVGAIVLDGATNYGELAYEVDCVTLDSLEVGDRSVVLKIDVEGREGGVIAGGRTLIQKKAKFVVMEYHRKVMESTGTDVDLLFSDFREWGFDPFVCAASELQPCTFEHLARSDGHMNIALKRRDGN
jgi:FkbM family methyltransferase